MVYLRDNAAIVAEIGRRAADGWPGVDRSWSPTRSTRSAPAPARRGLDRRRLVGYTANDSLRLRTAIGDQLGVRSSAVDAWVLGEHGDRFVPLLDRVRVDGEPVDLSATEGEAAERFVRHWYEQHVALDSGRSSTWTTGHGLARMVAALTSDEGELWPASVVLEGEYGVSRRRAHRARHDRARRGPRAARVGADRRAARGDGRGRRGRPRGRAADPFSL